MFSSLSSGLRSNFSSCHALRAVSSPVICVYPRSSATNLTKTTLHTGAADSYEGPVLALGGAEELRLPLPGAHTLGEVGARSAPREGRTNHGGGRSWQDRGARRWARLRAPNPP